MVLRTPSCVGFPPSGSTGSTAAVSTTTVELEVDVLLLASLTFLIVGSFCFFGGAGVGRGGGVAEAFRLAFGPLAVCFESAIALDLVGSLVV